MGEAVGAVKRLVIEFESDSKRVTGVETHDREVHPADTVIVASESDPTYCTLHAARTVVDMLQVAAGQPHSSPKPTRPSKQLEVQSCSSTCLPPEKICGSTFIQTVSPSVATFSAPERGMHRRKAAVQYQQPCSPILLGLLRVACSLSLEKAG